MDFSNKGIYEIKLEDNKIILIYKTKKDAYKANISYLKKIHEKLRKMDWTF